MITFLLLYFLRKIQYFLIKLHLNLKNVTTLKIGSQYAPLCWGTTWEIYGPIQGYVPVFLENHSIFSQKIFTSLFFIQIKFLHIILKVTISIFEYLFLSSIFGYAPLFLENFHMFSHKFFITMMIAKLENFFSSVPFFSSQPFWSTFDTF